MADIVAGISPGSPILYLLYSSTDGHCIKEDDHRILFDQAIRCIFTDDPFAGSNHAGGRNRPLLEVDVDSRGEVVYSGSAFAAFGWKRGGGPEIVPGPGTVDSADSALSFGGRWLQLGDGSGVDLNGNFSVVCRIHITARVDTDGTLVAIVHAGTSFDIELLAEDINRLAIGWHRLTVHVQGQVHQSDEAADRLSDVHRDVFVDGVRMPTQTDQHKNGSVFRSCSVSISAIGAKADGTASLPPQIHVHRIRFHPGLVDPNSTEPSDNNFAPIEYHAEMSRWVEISRGLDGVTIIWDTIGWEKAAHEQISLSLDPAGDILVSASKRSVMWERAIVSAGSVAGDFGAAATVDWASSSALNSTDGAAVRLHYIDSDPVRSSFVSCLVWAPLHHF